MFDCSSSHGTYWGMDKVKLTDPKAKTLASPKKYGDAVARMVLDRASRAKMGMSSMKIGRYTLREALTNSWEQYHSVPSACDADLLEQSGVDVMFSLTKHKTDVLQAWFRDLILQQFDMPFTFEHTPVVELSDNARRQARAGIKEQLFTGMMPGDHAGVLDVVRRAKASAIMADNQWAESATKRMSRVIEDQWVEARTRKHLLDYLFNFALNPYAVLLGPNLEMRPAFNWSGNTLKSSLRPTLGVMNVDPFKYYFSSDTPSGGQGSFDVIETQMTRQQLLDCANMQGYIKANILEAVQHYVTGTESFNWFGAAPQNGTLTPQTTGSWGVDDSITVLRHYGKLSGEELSKFGLSVDKHAFHECEAWVLGHWTIRLLVNPNPKVDQRPIYTSSYQAVPGQVAGYGLGLIIRDLERAFMAAARGVIENIGYSMAPLGEADYTRIQRYMAEDEIGSLVAGTVIPVDPDMTGGGRPAHYFHNVPNQTPAMIQLMEYFTSLVDRMTGLPAALSGQPIGTGVNRTYRGILELYRNALKGVQSALDNLENDVFSPLGEAYYNFNMQYHPDPEIKADARIKARGFSGVMQRELAKQNAQESLQFIAQLSQAGAVSPATASWAVNKALETMGVPDEVLAQQPPQQPALPPGQQPPQSDNLTPPPAGQPEPSV